MICKPGIVFKKILKIKFDWNGLDLVCGPAGLSKSQP